MIVEEYVRLTEEFCHKLDVVASSIYESKSKKQLVEAGIDIMFGHALSGLYMDGEITKDSFEENLNLLPDFMQESTRKKIEAEATK